MGRLLQYSLRQVLRNLATRIMVLIFLFLALVTFMLVYFSYQNHLSSAYSSEFKRLEVITRSLALQIDAKDHNSLFNEYQEEDAIKNNHSDKRYMAINSILNRSQVAQEMATDIYTLVKIKDTDEFVFGINSGPIPYYRRRCNNPNNIHIQEYDAGATIGPYDNGDGIWLSAFSPLIIEGETVAIVQADLRFNTFLAEARSEFISAILIYVVFFVLTAIVLLKWINNIIAKDNKLKLKFLEQTDVIRKRNSDIMASIRVAKRLQESVLPNLSAIKRDFPSFNVMYEPKDLVSGDFYWYERVGKKVYIAAGDCTGHGIPGGFMSMMASTALYHVLNKKDGDLGVLLTELDRIICKHLHNSVKNNEGMDLALCSFDTETGEFQFAGALRPMLIIKGNKLIKLNGDRVGIGRKSKEHNFSAHSVQVDPGDIVYLYSDGYSDQFGGESGKKYMSKRFRKFLTEIQDHPLEEQHYLIKYEFHHWKSHHEQVDDVLVMGFEIPEFEQRLTA